MELVTTRSKRIEVSGSGVNITFPPADEDYDKNRKVMDDACLMVMRETGAYDLFYSINHYCHGLRNLIHDLRVDYNSERSILRIELVYRGGGPTEILTFYKVLFEHKDLLGLIVNKIGVQSTCMDSVLKTEDLDHFIKKADGTGPDTDMMLKEMGIQRSEKTNFGIGILSKINWDTFTDKEVLQRKKNKANYRIFVNGFPLFEKQVRAHFNDKYMSSLKELNKILGELYELMSPHIAILRMS